MPRTSAALLLALILVPSAAVAQHSGTQAEQDACTPDVFRLCSAFIPDEGPILACLQSKHSELSAACEPVIFPHTAATAATPDASPAPRKHHRRKHRKSPTSS